MYFYLLFLLKVQKCRVHEKGWTDGCWCHECICLDSIILSWTRQTRRNTDLLLHTDLRRSYNRNLYFYAAQWSNMTLELNILQNVKTIFFFCFSAAMDHHGIIHKIDMDTWDPPWYEHGHDTWYMGPSMVWTWIHDT